MTADPAPLRIGLVSAYDLGVPGGVQTQVLGLAAELRRSGHVVGVLAPGPAVALGSGGRSTSAGRAWAVRSNGSVARIGFAVDRSVVADWSADFDVVHVHEPLAPGVSQAVLLASRRPVIATVHARADTVALRLGSGVLARRLRRAALVTAVSRHAALTVSAHLGMAARVIGNGVDVPVDPPVTVDPRVGAAGATADPRVGAAEPRVVAVGRLAEPRKGIDVLLAAWPEVRARHPRATLHLVGPGRPRGTRRGRPLPAGVVASGWVDVEARNAALDAADVVVAPHRGGESFGLVVAEAMARGCCVVASALPAFTDLLGPDTQGRRAGLTVAPDQPQALADMIDAALRDPAMRADLGARARQRIGRYAWSAVAGQWVQAYRALLA